MTVSFSEYVTRDDGVWIRITILIPGVDVKLFIKVLRFAFPFWKMILLSVFITCSYVVLDNFSLWVSVDLVQELFSVDKVSHSMAHVMTDSAVITSGPGQEKPSSKTGDLIGMVGISQPGSFYESINRKIKSWLIFDDKNKTLKIVCLVIILSFLLKNVCSYLRRVLSNYIGLHIVIGMRNKLNSKILRLPLSFFEKHSSGEFVSIVFNDVGMVNTILEDSFGKFLMIPLQILVNMLILLIISWKLTLITFLIIPISGILIVRIGKSIRRRSKRMFEQIANVTSVFQESVSSIRIVKAFISEAKEEKKFRDSNQEYFKKTFRANRLSYLTSPLNETLAAVILVLLLWFGGRMVYQGTGLNAEGFIRYLVFLLTMFNPLKELSKFNNEIQMGMAAAERIFRIIESPPEVYHKPGSIELKNFQYAVEFKDVTFQYDETAGPVLNRIDLRIHKGEMAAFVGHSGAGKSTLVDLIPHFYDVVSGHIMIDGLDINDYTLESLRRQIGIVTQDAILFNDTVRMNIGYGMEGATDDQIIEAAKIANAWDFIRQMDGGLSAMIGERGIKLSGGQKQRLSIARAVLKNPPILILDEATSALDSESEKIVQDAIDHLMKNRTVLAIAHRLSTIIHADKIVVLNQGNLVDVGRHSELLERCPVYQKLYDMQFKNQDRG